MDKFSGALSWPFDRQGKKRDKGENKIRIK